MLIYAGLDFRRVWKAKKLEVIKNLREQIKA
jgi:hypothetical protein